VIAIIGPYVITTPYRRQHRRPGRAGGNAQRYAMSDNSFGTTFGPSSPGAINLISGNTGTVA
jgi:hypothetical protein